MNKLLLTFVMILFGFAAHANEPLVTESTSDSKVTTDSTTTVISPPPTAIAPTINSSNSDLCTVGVSGAVQTQILGISAGKTVRDMNCEKLKNAKTMYDMGMKVAAVSVMCQDQRIFDAMMDAGTPCPYKGLIGDAAKAAWTVDQGKTQSEKAEEKKLFGKWDDDQKSTAGGIGGVLLLLLFLL